MNRKKLAGAPQEFLGPLGGGSSVARSSGGALVVGLTGGIGSGKSAAAACFAALGAPVVDTDVIAHELTAPGGAAIAPLREVFGAEALTPAGALDRGAMRRRVFADPAARARLEAILHPMIRAESARRLAGAEFVYALLVVPLLIESDDYRARVDRVAVVDCPEEVQIARVMSRGALTRDEVLAIMAAQASRAARRAAADDVIENVGDLDALGARVAALHSAYLRLGSGGS